MASFDSIFFWMVLSAVGLSGLGHVVSSPMQGPSDVVLEFSMNVHEKLELYPWEDLFAIVERYPELKANENFLQLQETLEQVEDAIQRSRRYYNAVVRDFNTTIETFPRNILATIFRFEPREFYALESEVQREAPRIGLR